MLKYKRTFHFFVAVKTFLVLAQKHISTSISNIASVHVVTIRARHFSFQNRMVVLEHKFTFDAKMAGETCFGIST